MTDPHERLRNKRDIQNLPHPEQFLYQRRQTQKK